MGQEDESWDDLRLFLYAAEEGSLARAATRAGCSTATVSRRLAKLERSFGLRLLHRHAGGVSLTPDAEQLLPAAQHVARAIDDLRRSAGARHRDGTHKVVVSTAETVVTHLIAPRLAEFFEAHPDIDLVLRSQARIVSIGERVADVALRLDRPTEANVRSRRVAMAPFGLFGTDSYIARHGSDVASLRGHSLVLLDERLDGTAEHRWVLDRLAGKRPVLRVSTISGCLRAIQSGAVIGLLPQFMGRNLRALTEPDVPPREVWLVVHEDLRDVPHVRAVTDFLASCVQPR